MGSLKKSKLDSKWTENYDLLKEYVEKEGRIPLNSYVNESGIKLGSWCKIQKRNIKAHNLLQERIDLLENIPGWSWDKREYKWYTNYKLLKNYEEIEGKLPDRFLTIDGIKIGNWIGIQRHNKKNDNLSKKRIKLLEEIPGWFWEQNLQDDWMKKYELLKKLNKTPICDYVTEEGVKLDVWCRIQKQNKKKKKLSQKRIDLLEKLHFWFWDNKHEDRWIKNYKLLKLLDYIPTQKEQLGVWCNTQRQDKKFGNLNQKRIKLLEEIPGWYWCDKPLTKLNWMDTYNLLKEYNVIFGIMPTSKEIYKDIKLGVWCGNQKVNKRKNKLPKERIDLLEKIPDWFWDFNDVKNDKWNDNYELLKKENKIPIATYITGCGVKLGYWCVKQRQEYTSEKLSQHKIQLLEGIKNWYWEPLEEVWIKRVESCRKEMKKNGNKYLPQKYIDENGFNLGSWVSCQISNKKNGTLSYERIKILESIPGWIWEFPSWDKKWFINNEKIKKYYEKNNKYPAKGTLYSWISVQRKQYKKGNLSKDKIMILENLPKWKWNVDQETWINYYNIAKTLTEKGIEIIGKYKTNDNINIGAWVSRQRNDYKNEKLSKKKIELLEKISGWLWDLDEVKNKKWENMYEICVRLYKKDFNYPISKCVTSEGIKIGNWVGRQKELYKKNKLPKEKINLLEKIPGWEWIKFCPNCQLFATNGSLCSYCKPLKNNKLYQKTKEYKVVEYMRNNIDKEFVHNKSVGDDCTKNDRENTNGHLYPDLRWDCGWFQLILEVDEFQHRGAEYKCDERRMIDIIGKLGMACVFIRYNPDNKDSNLEYLRIKIDEYLEEEEYIDNSHLHFDPFKPLITEYLYYK
jgi:hypothetical protein